MRFRAACFISLAAACLLLVNSGGRAQDSPPGEYQIKAAFLFNFARFVEWPPKTLADSASPLVIGVLGDNPFHEDLEKTVRNKTIDSHPLLVRQYRSPVEATNCQILFISNSEKNQLPNIIKNLKGTSVLTVGEMDQFTENGGMINFVMEGAKIRFQINNEAATEAGLKISAKLLTLALHSTK